MKKLLYIMAIACMVACQNDDTDFSAYTSGLISKAHVINITYNGNSVTVTGDNKGYVSTAGADVTVNAMGWCLVVVRQMVHYSSSVRRNMASSSMEYLFTTVMDQPSTTNVAKHSI